jgi:hypothetical protein
MHSQVYVLVRHCFEDLRWYDSKKSLDEMLRFVAGVPRCPLEAGRQGDLMIRAGGGGGEEVGREN